ncbi:hypothetical protein P4O66_003121 [Electrophorus voltai]|uniref:Peptidase M12B domain-containing protein n=1 Tax=Electrophorus voltai TaxID=2609070 RepID=A0AAD8YU20_9TELE|nr:hypothetical protein P4O66_003121 [Electrophorus voltai]
MRDIRCKKAGVRFISPTLKVYRIKTDGTSETPGKADRQVYASRWTAVHKSMNKTAEDDVELRGCFFTGTVDFRKDSVVALYVLTLVSVAAQIYKHSSIKNSLNVVVVKMMIVEDEELGPSVSSNGGLTLRSFCSWQQLFNPSSHWHPEHYDTALLLTREDICGHQSCDTLGVADVGTVCDPKRSCFVIEDSGLQASFTIAHELGHVLSMPHDDSKNCERHFGHLRLHHIMAPVFVGFNQSSPWSPCSAFYITEFFDNGHGDCLLDAPENTVPLPMELPGLAYGLDRQCRQAFGEGYSSCRNASADEACTQLWCQRAGQATCTTRNGSLPWADGTPCGPDRTCLDSVCTASEEVMKPKVPVDGSWGDWGAWQTCSRSCGGGVRFSYRECNRPAPQNGGRYCEGQRARYHSCNTQACESGHDEGSSVLGSTLQTRVPQCWGPLYRRGFPSAGVHSREKGSPVLRSTLQMKVPQCWGPLYRRGFPSAGVHSTDEGSPVLGSTLERRVPQCCGPLYR